RDFSCLIYETIFARKGAIMVNTAGLSNRQAISPPARKRPRIVTVDKSPAAAPARRKTRAPFRKGDVMRAISAVQKAGMDVGEIEISPDGNIRISTGNRKEADLFGEWEGRL